MKDHRSFRKHSILALHACPISPEASSVGIRLGQARSSDIMSENCVGGTGELDEYAKA